MKIILVLLILFTAIMGRDILLGTNSLILIYFGSRKEYVTAVDVNSPLQLSPGDYCINYRDNMFYVEHKGVKSLTMIILGSIFGVIALT